MQSRRSLIRRVPRAQQSLPAPVPMRLPHIPAPLPVFKPLRIEIVSASDDISAARSSELRNIAALADCLRLLNHWFGDHAMPRDNATLARIAEKTGEAQRAAIALMKVVK